MTKRATIYRYYYNPQGIIEYKVVVKQNDRITTNYDLPFVETDQDININQKKYNAAQAKFVTRQDSVPTVASVRR